MIKLGVGPEIRVGIAVERSIEMIVGLLAILKAGGAYVPLDVTYPVERLHFMVADTDAPVLLTQARFAHLFTKTQAVILPLDRQGDEISCQSETNPKRILSAALPAYAIYTSGSTGVPKGVIIPHRAINRLVYNTNFIDIQATDHIAQVSNASFDAATFEIWGALAHGALLAIVPEEVLLSPYEFAAYLRTQSISILFLTTALFNQIAHSIPNAFATLRVLLFGGEIVDPNPVRLVLQQGAPSHCLHVYGPTECTTFSTWHPIQSISDDALTIPIGSALANTQLYVLDNHLQPVPVGVAGELYIGGDGVALRYHNQLELTATKFIKNPFNSVQSHVGSGDGEYLFKTGDRVRWSSIATLEFLGRIDNQVKIRGFRVEPGEIETLLNSHPEVSKAVVVARESERGDKQLVAYVVSSSTPSELRAYLASKLPNYMLPAFYVQLDALPLTPNGKIDRRALPAPDMSRATLEEDFVAPRSPLESQLAEIWAELLEIERVGIHDNFFELGGHSLKAMQVVTRICGHFRIDFPLRQFFEAATIAETAVVITQLQAAQVDLAELETLLTELETVARHANCMM